MSEALKPCPNPWCSGKRIVIWDLYSKRVKCTCGVMGPRSETKMDTDQGVPLNNKTIDVCVAEAIDSWNTRAPATDEQAFANEKVKALVEALQYYNTSGYEGKEARAALAGMGATDD